MLLTAWTQTDNPNPPLKDQYGLVQGCPRVGLGRVCAQPGTDPPESGEKKKCTHRRPAGVIGSDSSNHQWVAGGSVEVIDLKTWRENGEKNTDPAKNPDSGEFSLISNEISPDPAKISLDLMRYRQIRSKSHRI